MKKYNRLITFSVLLYVMIAVTVGYGAYQTIVVREKEYKIEINRIYNSLSKGLSLDELSLDSYTYIQNIVILPIADQDNEEILMEFYAEGNLLRLEIRPLFVENELKGYVRFEYEEPEFNLYRVIVFTESGLGLMALLCIGILLYLKYQILRPFERMRNLPFEIAKGHLRDTVKEEKSRFFGGFLWGLGQLQDTLDITKKRELELEREKKLMFLSLSHDIKTPLNTIKLYGKALEENLYQDEQQKQNVARQIGEKAQEIENYVEEIMKNSREDILDIHVEKGEFYLDVLMRKVLGTYEEKCKIRMTELQVDTYENRLMCGDLERTQEVFDNLFENAFKYGDGRKIEMSFYEEDYCQLIRMYNTGVPVTDTEFNHIFESFFRAGNSEGKSGNGLGLYICREIMRKMGGEIFAEKEEEGMAFILVFR